MSFRVSVLVAAVLVLGPVTGFAQQYLCVADLSTGFGYNETAERWVRANFNVENNKYIISEKSEQVISYREYRFGVTQVGEEVPDYYCESGFEGPGFLSCESFIGLGTFQFNKDNGRFLRAYWAGYFNVLPKVNDITDATSDTPLIEIGKCSPF